MPKPRRTRAERERSYYYPSVKEDQAKERSWRDSAKSITPRLLRAGIMVAVIAIFGQTVVSQVETSLNEQKRQTAAQIQAILKPTPPPAPVRTAPMPEPTVRQPNPPPPATSRPTPPAPSTPQKTPAPVQALSSTPRRTLQECMAPGSNEVNAKVLACMNGK